MRGHHPTLRRELRTYEAILMGLGSIVGTGVFVSIGLAAGVAGPAVIPAIALAALVALCNGLSSAQLAANHPVSGGTYEYGHRWATPTLGFLAGWLFLLAKSASAATAALGFSGYVLNAFKIASHWALVGLALVVVLALTLLVLSGIRNSSRVNSVVVTVTLFTLLLFILSGLVFLIRQGPEHLWPLVVSPGVDRPPSIAFFEACALMFVAFTGYGRIATLSEEVHEPRQTIPRAIWITLGVAATLYIGVGLVAVGSVGAADFYEMTQGQAAPLEIISRRIATPMLAWIVALGAITAMFGVLLNLILGLSRVLLAMGRRGDMPRLFGRLNLAATTPVAAVIAMGLLIGLLTLLGSVHTTWSFSAFTVLVYYAITNYCALRLTPSERFIPRWVAAVGMVCCLLLAFFVEVRFWVIGLGLIAVGLIWQRLANRLRQE